jgi:hypothetical protein
MRDYKNPTSLLSEGFDDVGTPDMKYYAFDWDDNILQMPTEIVVTNDKGDEIGMSTEDFAEYRVKIGKEPFNYKGETIVGFAPDAFRNFTTKGDKQFLIDAMKAKPGPAWSDFVEAVNNGSIFSIITARGHNPDTLKEGVFNMIVSDHMGINKNLLIKNLKKYRDITGLDDKNDLEIIREYMDLLKFYPVSFGQGESAASPEELKVMAMKEFINYVKQQAKSLGKKLYIKDDVRNKFVPRIGFSDDDLRNVELMKKHFEDEPALQTYSTAGGVKQKF